MNITIIKNANIYAPEKLGIKDLLVCNGKIVMIDDQIDLTGVKHSMIDAGGLIVTPGFIDQHMHICLLYTSPELYWKISINAARNWNRFKESENGKDDDTRIIGKALNGIYLLKTDGYINDQNEMPLFYNAAGIKMCIRDRF